MQKKREILYEKIEHYIMGLINNKQLRNGDYLPPEREISRKFKTSHIPVRQATQNLIEKGILQKNPGKGAYVKRAVKKDIKTNKIALLYLFKDDALFTSSYYSLILSGINLQAQKEERSVLFRSLNWPKNEQPGQALHELEDEVDGFLAVGPNTALINELRRALEKVQKPLVVLDYEGELADMDSVVFNNRESTARMIKLLLEAGHTRIGFIYVHNTMYGTGVDTNFANRFGAYQETLRAHGITPDSHWVACLKDRQDLESFKKFMAQNDPPTALFCFDDMCALSLYPMARTLGINIPDDLSLAGYDGIPEGETAMPKLTTIWTPLKEMGMVGVKRLLEKQKEQDAATHIRLVLNNKIMERESHKVIHLNQTDGNRR